MRQTIIAICLAVSALMIVLPAHAAIAVKPKQLRMPLTAFPAAAQFPIDRVETNAEITAQTSGATSDGFLPSWFFSDSPKHLGRISGYVQVAVWSDPSSSSVGYVSTLASIYPDAPSALHAHAQAVTNIRHLRGRYGHINVTSRFPTIGDRDAVFHMAVQGTDAEFNFYLLAFTRGPLEFEVVLALPAATGRQPARADLLKLAQIEDGVAQRLLALPAGGS